MPESGRVRRRAGTPGASSKPGRSRVPDEHATPGQPVPHPADRLAFFEEAKAIGHPCVWPSRRPTVPRLSFDQFDAVSVRLVEYPFVGHSSMVPPPCNCHTGHAVAAATAVADSHGVDDEGVCRLRLQGLGADTARPRRRCSCRPSPHPRHEQRRSVSPRSPVQYPHGVEDNGTRLTSRGGRGRVIGTCADARLGARP